MAKFVKGQSGNPSGRPSDAALKDLCRARTAQAVQTLGQIMANKKAPASARVAAACALLDRGYGKPAQAITGPEGGPLQFEEIRRTIIRPK